MIRALLLEIMLLGTACARTQHIPYASIEELCWSIYHGGPPLPGGGCDPDSRVTTIYDVNQAQEQGMVAVRERARRRNRPNKYLRYDRLLSFHELFDKDHDE